jgi:hypothetical protein
MGVNEQDQPIMRGFTSASGGRASWRIVFVKAIACRRPRCVDVEVQKFVLREQAWRGHQTRVGTT